jgi:uncharacterized protein YbjT (DUF2867 family)
VKYFLNHISPTLAAIARALACEGIGHTHSYAEEIRTIERALRQLYPAEQRAQAMPKQGASSGFKYGRAVGTIEAAILCCEIPMTIIEPAVWKRALHLRGKDKEGARQLALQRFPAAHALLARRDHQRAEAALIALTASPTTR